MARGIVLGFLLFVGFCVLVGAIILNANATDLRSKDLTWQEKRIASERFKQRMLRGHECVKQTDHQMYYLLGKYNVVFARWRYEKSVIQKITDGMNLQHADKLLDGVYSQDVLLLAGVIEGYDNSRHRPVYRGVVWLCKLGEL